MATNSLDLALDNIQQRRKGPQCSVGALLDSLPDATANKLIGLIDNHSISSTSIADALGDGGHNILVAAIRRHRNRGKSRGCACT